MIRFIFSLFALDDFGFLHGFRSGCENTDVFISLDDNIYGIHSKRVNILYIFSEEKQIQKQKAVDAA